MQQQLFLPYEKLSELLLRLNEAGYESLAPQVKNGMISHEVFTDPAQLPWGIQDVQAPGSYQLKKTKDQKAFAYTVSQQGIKPLVFKPREAVFKVKKLEGKLTFVKENAPIKKLALWAVRACDLRALAIQDQVFISGTTRNAEYAARRENLFIIAANCTYATSNCFCVGAGGYPKAQDPFDLNFTEINKGLVIQAGSELGFKLLTALNLMPASNKQIESAEIAVKKAADSQTKQLPFQNERELRDSLMQNLNHPRYEEVAKRCLSCGNCILVCPTCFCYQHEEKPNLEDTENTRFRSWDSCFSQGHSLLHGHPHHDTTSLRYRQWITHKLGTWHDQYGTSGCVGCGRCITFCPVGIDITEEAHALIEEKS